MKHDIIKGWIKDMNIGIDIGGSHIGIGLVDSNGKIQKKLEQNITQKERNDIKTFLKETIINTINEWIKKDNISIKKIGIGIPGIVKESKIKYSVNLGISNYDLKSILKKEFPNIEINIKNDAKCAGLAEKNLGALKKINDCIFICLGTGIGGAAFYNGKLITPKRSSGFEFGHMILQKNGEPCRCGSKGCFEIYGSMRRFKNDIRTCLNFSEEIEGEKLLNSIKENLNNEKIINIINEYIENLCIGISNIVDLLEPQAICIGGSFVYYKDILLQKLEKELYNSNYIFYKENMPKIVVAELGNDAGIIGSALYA